MTINFELHPKQTFVLETEATEILFGGGAGGGKSFILRILAILCGIYIPNIQIYLFRRLSPDLQANHMDGEKGFRNVLSSLVAHGDVRIVEDEIRFKNGAKIHLAHCQHEKDMYKYQGAEIHLLCCEENEKIRMADGSLKLIKDVCIGDYAQTLQGAKKVTYKGERQLKKCVEVNVGDRTQIHTTNHAVLTPSGWISYDDMCDASRLSVTSLSTLYCSGDKSEQPSSTQSPSVLKPHDNQEADSPRIQLPFLSFQDHQSQLETSFYEGQPIQETDSAMSEYVHPESSQPFSGFSFQAIRAVHSHAPKAHNAEAFSLRDALPYVPSAYTCVNYSRHYSTYCRLCDVYPLSVKDKHHDVFPQLNDVALQIPKSLLSDDVDTTRNYILYNLQYAHPYSGEERIAAMPVQIDTCEVIPCGERWTIDLTIEDENHYITESGLVNKNCIDELTHFSEPIYRFLRNRVRMPPAIPDIAKKIFGDDFTLPKIVCGSNPGNVGHTFVKRTFIDMVKPFEVVRMPPEEGGMLRQYIPALLEDNPSLMLNDPGYELRLEGLGSPDLVKAMRYGLWDITAGAALEKLRRDKHMIRDFQVPETWTTFMVIDWGSAKPFSVGWFCVVDDDLVLKAKGEWPERLIPRGALIRYREYYGWNGKANEGCRLESGTVARNILDIEEEAGEEMDYRVGDSAMWAEHDGKSTQERMYDATNGQFLMERSKKDRANNFEEVRARIAGDDDAPMLYVTESCKHWWRTVPDLQLDERKPESGPESSQEDHPYDDTQYACASRPYITTRKERLQAAIQEAKRQARKNS